MSYDYFKKVYGTQGMDDEGLLDAIHQKFYAPKGVPREVVFEKAGVPIPTNTFMDRDKSAPIAQRQLQPVADFMSQAVSSANPTNLPLALGGDKTAQNQVLQNVYNAMTDPTMAITSPFYSALERALGSPQIPKKPQSVIPFLKKQGVTDAEINSVGLFDYLKGKERVEPTELLDLVKERGVKFGEDTYGGGSEMFHAPTALQYLEEGQAVKNRYTGRIYEPSEIDKLKQFVIDNGNAGGDFELYIKDKKTPQFPQATYRSIKSEDGVVPDSYTEKFVTVLQDEGIQDTSTQWAKMKAALKEDDDLGHGSTQEAWESIRSNPHDWTRRWDASPATIKAVEDYMRAYSRKSGWKDEHSQYSDTKNPLARIRYDVKEYPDGRKTLRIQEIQEPDPVRKSRKGGGTVPPELADRAMDAGIKQAIADAKAQGLDGIEWGTGEQTRDLYNSALRGVADEARWNPETEKLSLFKDGHPSPVQSEIPAQVPRERLGDYLPKDAVGRLLGSERGISDWFEDIDGWKLLGTDYRIDKGAISGQYGVFQKGTVLQKFPDLAAAKSYAEKLTGKAPEHIATDLSIDKKWPTALYGDFGDAGFDYKAVVPSLLKKYGKGEFGVTESAKHTPREVGDYRGWYEGDAGAFWNREYDHNPHSPEITISDLMHGYGDPEPGFLVTNVGTQQEKWFATFDEAVDHANELGGYTPIAADNVIPKGETVPQPVMWFTDKTPSSFPMYSMIPVPVLYFMAQKGDEQAKEELQRRMQGTQ